MKKEEDPTKKPDDEPKESFYVVLDVYFPDVNTKGLKKEQLKSFINESRNRKAVQEVLAWTDFVLSFFMHEETANRVDALAGVRLAERPESGIEERVEAERSTETVWIHTLK